MNKWYILDENNNLVESNIIEFSKFPKERLNIAKTNVDNSKISTVFLGLDHSWSEDEILVFETMVFGGDLDGEMARYSTHEEAQLGHQIMVNRVKKYHS